MNVLAMSAWQLAALVEISSNEVALSGVYLYPAHCETDRAPALGSPH